MPPDKVIDWGGRLISNYGINTMLLQRQQYLTAYAVCNWEQNQVKNDLVKTQNVKQNGGTRGHGRRLVNLCRCNTYVFSVRQTVDAEYAHAISIVRFGSRVVDTSNRTCKNAKVKIGYPKSVIYVTGSIAPVE